MDFSNEWLLDLLFAPLILITCLYRIIPAGDFHIFAFHLLSFLG